MLTMPSFDHVTGTVTLPLWAAGAITALLVVCCLIAVLRSGANVLGATVGLAAVVIGAGVAWVALERAATRDRVGERNALEARLLQLTAQAIAPGSSLACLDAAAGDAVDAACEKALFASPESVAGAVAYVSARLALLSDGLEYARRSDPNYEASLAVLRRGLESDRFGVLAFAVGQRDDCAVAQCDALAPLRDPSRVQANLKERVFDGYVTRYAVNWPARGSRPVADAGTAPTGIPMSSKYSFPSASSIPPVSIMNAEPASGNPAPPPMQPLAAQGAPSAAASAAPPPPRRAQATRPPPRAQAANQAPRHAPLPLQVPPQPETEQPNTSTQ